MKETKEQQRKDPSHPRYYMMRWDNLLSFILAGVNFYIGMEWMGNHPLLAAGSLILTGWLLNMFIANPVIRSYSYMCKDYNAQVRRLLLSLEMMRKRSE